MAHSLFASLYRQRPMGAVGAMVFECLAKFRHHRRSVGFDFFYRLASGHLAVGIHFGENESAICEGVETEVWGASALILS